MHIHSSVKQYLDDVAAKKASPGGGSASALAGALGAALLAMSANFTIGKQMYRDFEREVIEILESVEGIRKRLMDLIDADAEAYGKVALAFKSKEPARVDDALKEATAIPSDIARASLDAMRQAGRLVNRCNINMVCDIGVAHELLASSYEGAKYSIRTNLAVMKDAGYVSCTRKRIETMDADMASLRKQVAGKVKSIMEKN